MRGSSAQGPGSVPRKRPWRCTHRVAVTLGDLTVDREVMVERHVGRAEDGTRLVERTDHGWRWIGQLAVDQIVVTARPGVRPAAGVTATERVELRVTPATKAAWEVAAARVDRTLSQWLADAAEIALAGES